MTLRPPTPTAAVDRIGRHALEYRATKLTNKLASAFIGWQRAFIGHSIDLSANERFAAGVLLTMAISERSDLIGIDNSGVIYETQDGPTLEWIRQDGRRGARLLSSLVILAVDQDFDPRCGGQFESALTTALGKLDPALAACENPIEAALTCSEAWVFQELTDFFSHVSGDLPMTPLPRSAWARLETKGALPFHFDRQLGTDDDAVSAIAGFLQSAAKDEDAATLFAIIKGTNLRDGQIKSDEQLLQDLAASWRSQIDSAEAAGPLTSLQLACALHLAYEGSHKPGTIIGYVRDGFPLIHQALAGCELVTLSSKELSTRLARALDTVTGQKRRNAKAYLGHLWTFARQWIDVEPLLPNLLPEVAVGPVDANLVWDHEGQRMDDWLGKGQPDKDLACQTRLVRRLMGVLKARAAEIFFLQIRNVHLYPGKDYVDIEIVSRGRLHGLKSKDAQRMARVDGALAAELVGQVNRRLIEQGGMSSHLLFGTKSEPEKVYRLSAMYSWLNRAVKAATGDPTSCCHHFRHAAIDGVYAAMSLSDIYAGALEQLRADSGHVDLRSTQRSYLHRFTRTLRDAAQASIAEFVKLSDTKAGAWIGCSPASLRQRRARSSHSVSCATPDREDAEFASSSEWYWAALQAAAQEKVFAKAATGFAMCCPLPPKALGARRPWSVIDVLGFLGDLQQGCTPAQAGRQRRLPEAVGETISQALLKMGQEQLQSGRQPLDVVLTSPAAALAALKLRVVTAFQTKYGTWLNALAAEPPRDFPNVTWESWLRATRGQYIKLLPSYKPDRWLAHLVATGLPPSKLLICMDDTDPPFAIAIRRLVRTSLGQGLVSGGSVRFESCPYNDRRGRCYLLVANEDETLTNHTGAAFSPAGLKVIVLAMYLAHVAKETEIEGIVQ